MVSGRPLWSNTKDWGGTLDQWYTGRRLITAVLTHLSYAPPCAWGLWLLGLLLSAHIFIQLDQLTILHDCAKPTTGAPYCDRYIIPDTESLTPIYGSNLIHEMVLAICFFFYDIFIKYLGRRIPGCITAFTGKWGLYLTALMDLHVVGPLPDRAHISVQHLSDNSCGPGWLLQTW